jgi:hypothetical protein
LDSVLIFPTSVSGDDWNERNDLASLAVDHFAVVIHITNPIQVCVAVWRLSSLKLGNVKITLGANLFLA